jgi:hypothetical protein
MTEDKDTLTGKVDKWINTEGYPLEYFTANTFQKAGFSVSQGDYSHDGDSGPREIDVLAWSSGRTEEQRLIRLFNVVECKWTRNKPWVVFTSPNARRKSSEIIAQTLGSRGGAAAIWAHAGNPELGGLELFQSSGSAGFGGRQALSDGQDKFYSSLRSITAATLATVNSYNPQIAYDFPDACVLAFPVIVIDGDLFEAHYAADTDALHLEPREHTRCHWRGSGYSPFPVTIEIVTKTGLPDFASRRAAEFAVLEQALRPTFDQLRHCYDKKDPGLLAIHGGVTGMSGDPALWFDILRRAENG